MLGFAPFAVNRNIAPGDNDPPITPRAVILHVAASLATTLFFFFRDRSGGIESHFFITLTGKIEQYRSIYRQADANLDANNFAVSIETAGLGGGRWNPLQRRAIRKLLLWLNDETNGQIPLRRIRSWNGSGVGYHTMWGSPSHWTPVAKSCPGPERIKQFDNDIVPWMKTALSPRTGVATVNIGAGDDDMKVTRIGRRIHAGVTLIGFQEASDRRAMFAKLKATFPSWKVYQPRAIPGAAAVPIAYDRRVWKRLHFRSLIAVARRWVGPKGAGPRFAKPKDINVVVFKHRASGEVVAHLNTHMIPSVRRGGLSAKERQARREHFERHIMVLARIISRHPERPTVVTMDSNAVPGDPLLVPLHKVGLEGWNHNPTHRDRPIDQVLTLHLGDEDPETHPFSDHRSVSRGIILAA